MPSPLVIGGAQRAALAQPPRFPTFPTKPHASGRYKVDALGAPFYDLGFAIWDLFITCSLADCQTALQALKARGYTFLHTYLLSSVPYATGGPQPANVNGDKPFFLNSSGTTWDGDPTFTHHDAALDSPNDAYFADYWAKVAYAQSLGFQVGIHPIYAGAKHTIVGDNDGWFQTLINAHNVTAICTGFGQYLATGHGTFGGFASLECVEWIWQGDSGVGDGTIGSTGSTRMQAVFSGLRTNGATQVRSQHVTHDNLPNDMTDYSGNYDLYCAYTYSSVGSISGEVRGCYGQSPARPVKVIETHYPGDGGLTRAQFRYQQWSGAISARGGIVTSLPSPFWTFFSSPDGTTGGVTVDCQPNCWVSGATYTLGQYVHKGGNIYRAKVGGVAGSTGPSGTSSGQVDGGVTWDFAVAVSANLGGMGNLWDEPMLLDHQKLGAFMASIPWWLLEAENLGSTGSLIASGQGTPPTWTDGSGPTGGANWVVSALASDGSILVAYVPSAYSGTFTLTMTNLARGNCTVSKVDPTTLVETVLSQGVANTGTYSVSTTTLGTNAGGDGDWLVKVHT